MITLEVEGFHFYLFFPVINESKFFYKKEKRKKKKGKEKKEDKRKDTK